MTGRVRSAVRVCGLAVVASLSYGCAPKLETASEVVAATPTTSGEPEHLEPLPPVPDLAVDASKLVFGRDPFVPLAPTAAARNSARDGDAEPLPPLRLDPSGIRLIRTLQHNGSRYALVATRDNDLYRVTIGDVLAPRSVVRNITENELLLSINGVERRLTATR